MVNKPLARARLITQGVAAPLDVASTSGTAEHVQDIAAHFGATQGQDLPGTISALAYRLGTAGAVDAVHQAFEQGLIVRGYPMRGTVFVTAAEDLAWITELCSGGPAKSAMTNRPRLGLEDKHVEQAADIHADIAVDGGCTRSELFDAFEHNGIPMGPGCGYHLLKALLHHGMAAYGPLAGESARLENRVMVADNWLPKKSGLEDRFNGDEHAAIVELLRRYLDSHGPASLRDFAWWSKLPLGKIRQAFAEIKDRYAPWDTSSSAPGEELWLRHADRDRVLNHEKSANKPRLLAAFDEVILGYPDRMYIVPEAHHADLVPGNNGIFRQAVIASGEVIGFWKRQGSANKRTFVMEKFKPLSPTRAKQLQARFNVYPFATA